MKKISLLLVTLLSLITLVGCSSQKQADIMTTMYFQYDIVKEIVKDELTVDLLIPAGVEVHDYELTQNDLIAIKESKIFMYTSLELNPWVEDPDTIGGDDTIVLDLSTLYTLAPHEHEETVHVTTSLEVEDDHDHDHDHAAEVHYWTDPTTIIQLIDVIVEQIITIDPSQESFYQANADAYILEITEAHEMLETLIEAHEDIPIYFAGHNAMGAFAERYHLTIISLFEAFKPDADLTLTEIVEFATAVKDAHVAYIFIEELAEPRAAEMIVDELDKYDITLLELHGYHNVTQTELEEGVSYVDLMLRNYQHLQIAFGVTPND